MDFLTMWDIQASIFYHNERQQYPFSQLQWKMLIFIFRDVLNGLRG